MLTYRSLFYPFYALLVLCTLLVMGAPEPAFAQITRATRVELDTTTERFFIGPHIYDTVDENHRLSVENIFTRYNNQSRGLPLNEDLINFGLGADARWLSFSVRNNTNKENWFLDFGSVFQGRLGHIKELAVHNYSRGDIYHDSLSETPVKGFFLGSALAVKITPGKTELFIVYLENAKNLPATFAPSFLSDKNWATLSQISAWVTWGFYTFFIAVTGFFLALTILRQQRWY